MKHRLISVILALGVLIALFAVPVTAAESCGARISWEYENGVLTLSGEGEMYDFPEGAPWHEHRKEITRVVLEGSITYIGANAFRDYDNLQSVDFGDALYEIGSFAFASCDALTVIYLPESFKVFGESCFLSCEKLSAIYSAGKFPSFRQDCLWDTYATIYYPVDRPWSQELIGQLEAAFNGRIRFLASDGTDPYAPTEVTTVPTTVPETTEATTVPTTVPETTVPVTTQPVLPTQSTAPTAPATQATAAPTEPSIEEPADDRPPAIFWGALIALCVSLTLIILAALTLKSGGKRRRY